MLAVLLGLTGLVIAFAGYGTILALTEIRDAIRQIVAKL